MIHNVVFTLQESHQEPGKRNNLMVCLCFLLFYFLSTFIFILLRNHYLITEHLCLHRHTDDDDVLHHTNNCEPSNPLKDGGTSVQTARTLVRRSNKWRQVCFFVFSIMTLTVVLCCVVLCWWCGAGLHRAETQMKSSSHYNWVTLCCCFCFLQRSRWKKLFWSLWQIFLSRPVRICWKLSESFWTTGKLLLCWSVRMRTWVKTLCAPPEVLKSTSLIFISNWRQRIIV